MSNTIWIVMGSTGEYSDRTEWLVNAWQSEKDGQDRVKFLEQKMQELGANNRLDYEEQEKVSTRMREDDPSFYLDYTGTRYFLCQTELKP